MVKTRNNQWRRRREESINNGTGVKNISGMAAMASAKMAYGIKAQQRNMSAAWHYQAPYGDLLAKKQWHSISSAAAAWHQRARKRALASSSASAVSA